MIQTDLYLRECECRQHRAVSLFCVIQCWLNKEDGIRISKNCLLRLLGLKRFKSARVVWLSEDFKDFFPNQRTDQQWPSIYFNWLELSRHPFDQNPRIGNLQMWTHPSDEDFAKLYEGFMPFFADTANYDERLLASYLSLLTQGQISPQLIPPAL